MKLPSLTASPNSSASYRVPGRAPSADGLTPAADAMEAFWDCVRVNYYQGSYGTGVVQIREDMNNRCPQGGLNCYAQNARWLAENLDGDAGMRMLRSCWPGAGLHRL